MSFSKVKALVAVFALLIFTGFITVGCKQKAKDGWVNTNSMPGHALEKASKTKARHGSATIVYLGSDGPTRRSNFGPKDPSFDFEDLK